MQCFSSIYIGEMSTERHELEAQDGLESSAVLRLMGVPGRSMGSGYPWRKPKLQCKPTLSWQVGQRPGLRETNMQ